MGSGVESVQFTSPVDKYFERVFNAAREHRVVL